MKSIEDTLIDNRDEIDGIILEWIGEEVLLSDPTSEVYISGILVAYDGSRVVLKNATSDIIEGKSIVYFLDVSMSISLVEREKSNKVLHICKDDVWIDNVRETCDEAEETLQRYHTQLKADSDEAIRLSKTIKNTEEE